MENIKNNDRVSFRDLPRLFSYPRDSNNERIRADWNAIWGLIVLGVIFVATVGGLIGTAVIQAK